jgi:hypothetical protein
MLAYESAILAQEATLAAGTEVPKLPMDAGTYSNFANVCMGHLRTLGLERKQRRVRGLRELMDGGR